MTCQALIGCRRAAMLLVVVVFAQSAGCSSCSSTRISWDVPAELAEFGALVSVTDEPIVASVGPEAKTLPLYDGAALAIPEGAFDRPATLTVTRANFALTALTIYSGPAYFYVLSTDEHFPALAQPVLLTVPNPEGAIRHGSLEDGLWVKSPAPTGDLEVPITHFSALEQVVYEMSREDLSFKSELANNELVDSVILKGDTKGWSAKWLGAGEMGDPTALCDEFAAVLERNRGKWNFQKPPLPAFTWGLRADLGWYLFDARDPAKLAEEGNMNIAKYWQITETAMQAIRGQVVAVGDRSVSPARLLEIAVEASGGDVALGVLAAHNYLKHIRYAALPAIKKDKKEILAQAAKDPRKLDDKDWQHANVGQIDEEYGLPAAKLKPWRRTDRAPWGYRDKLGPLYHIFAAMTASTWFPWLDAGSDVSKGEELMRSLKAGDDRPDPDKGDADLCGAKWGDRIRALMEGHACGDGAIDFSDEADGEQCDDGNFINDDDCTNDCRLARCTDGICASRGEEGHEDADSCPEDCAGPDAGMPCSGDCPDAGVVDAGPTADAGPPDELASLVMCPDGLTSTTCPGFGDWSCTCGMAFTSCGEVDMLFTAVPVSSAGIVYPPGAYYVWEGLSDNVQFTDDGGNKRYYVSNTEKNGFDPGQARARVNFGGVVSGCDPVSLSHTTVRFATTVFLGTTGLRSEQRYEGVTCRPVCTPAP